MHQPRTNPPSRAFSAATILLAICTVFNPVLGNDLTSFSQSVYEFVPTESSITQTGGFAGVDWTYALEGRFQLSIDPNAGTAAFTAVDANAVRTDDPSQSLDPNEVLNLTGLSGTLAVEGTYIFRGHVPDGSSVEVTLTLEDSYASLVAQTTPPPNSADYFIFTLDAAAQRKYAGGTGTPHDPYEIATASDLIELGESPLDYDKHFVLTADIDLSGYAFDRAVIAPDADDTRSEFQGTAFRGSLDGQGYVVGHLRVEGKDYLGLFGRCFPGAVITHLGLEIVDVSGTGGYVGGLVGYDSGTVTSCYSTGTIDGQYCVGGLMGSSDGTITSNCSAGTVGGAWSIGGLVGSSSAAITSCCSTGTVSGTDRNIGGLVGNNYDAPITASYSTGIVKGTAEKVGGLVGYNDGTITSSYSTGAVRGREDVGGLVGYDYDGSTVSSFWDAETSGTTRSDGGAALTTSEMRGISTFLNAGWDFVGETANGTCDYWLDGQGDYPKLTALSGLVPELSGGGTIDDPYMLTDASDLGTVWHRPNAYYRLDSDIDLAGIIWNAAVIPEFIGYFDGNGHVIRNLRIEGGDRLGLFGHCGYKAIVCNLGLETVNVNGTGRCVGGLVGYDDFGTITSCYSSGTVNSSDARVGGLVGYSYYGAITSCYSTGTVSGTSEVVGGLVGYNAYGAITSCYSIGSISGNDDVGGLVGYNCGGTITSCYSTGTVTSSGTRTDRLVGHGASVSSLWIVETSGQSDSAGSTGLTTSKKLDINTFLEAGWDFVGETANGTCDYWLDGQGDYPKLVAFSGLAPPKPMGSGTANDPYVLSDANDLGTIWYRPDAYYRLDSDIDLGGIIWNVAVVPVLAGCLDGNGHVIQNFRINGGGHLGLFGLCSYKATISDLGLEAVNINGTEGYIGGLVGFNDGTIASCHSSGIVSGTSSNVGGLAGYNRYGAITSSYSIGTVTGTWTVGGLVANNHDGTITSCHSAGIVSGTSSDVGGLAGFNHGTIASCYSHADASGTDNTGGLVGWNHHGEITSCYSTGSASGADDVGGLVGFSYDAMIVSCYSTGAVRGEEYTGGLVGENRFGTVASSFWDIDISEQTASGGGRGLTTAAMLDIDTFLDIGWDFVDENQNGREDTWFMPAGSPPGLTWSRENYATVPDVVGMAAQQAEDAMLALGLCVSIIYQFDETVPDDYVVAQDDAWGREILVGTPVSLVIAVAIDGIGTQEDPYQIVNARQLMALGGTPSLYDKNFLLGADIDLDPNLPHGKVFEQAVIAPTSLEVYLENREHVLDGPPFAGSFDGQGYAIRNLHVHGADCLGLFGSLAPEAQVSNLRMCDVDIMATHHFAGALVAYNQGSVSFCQSQGVVRGANHIGGLVGLNDGAIIASQAGGTASGDRGVGGLVGNIGNGNVSLSCSSGQISGTWSVGGLAGENSDGSIASSYSSGVVIGSNRVGGLVGYNYGVITSSYSTGSASGNYGVGGLVGVRVAGKVASSFWDIETSGQPASDGGIGLTTAEMQIASTFLEAGWDFVGETENGSEDIWWMPEGGYPRLWWELVE